MCRLKEKKKNVISKHFLEMKSKASIEKSFQNENKPTTPKVKNLKYKDDAKTLQTHN